MKAILIDGTSHFIQQLQQTGLNFDLLDVKPEPFHAFCNPTDYVRSVQKMLESIASNEETFIFINVHLKSHASLFHQDCIGMDIAYELAASWLPSFFTQKEVPVLPTIILFSCLSKDKLILKRPKTSSVLFLPCVDFIQVPFFPDTHFFQRALQHSRNNLENKKSLLQRNWSWKLSEDRHSLANRIGLYIMRGILHNLNKEPYEAFFSNLPPDVQEALFAFSRGFAQEAPQGFQQQAKNLSLRIRQNLRLNVHSPAQSHKIALIDDEAYCFSEKEKRKKDLGWLPLYEKMIGGGESHSGFIIDVLDMPFESGSETTIRALLEEFKPNLALADNRPVIQKVGRAIIDRILENNCICILLDIKLLGSKEVNSIGQNSGAQLLRILREELPTHPIIVTTASNKANKHKVLEILKADAIWVKEGLDQNHSTEESFWNYLRFLELLQIATGPEYQFLSRLGQKIKMIKSTKAQFWWENKLLKEKTWRIKSLPEVNRKSILPILNQVIDRVREHLSVFYLDYSLINESTNISMEQKKIQWESNTIKDIILVCGKIIELIHGKRFNEKYRVTSGTIGGFQKPENGKTIIIRGDWVGFALYQLRNESAHFFDFHFTLDSNDQFPTRSLFEFLSHFLAYLDSLEMPFHYRKKEVFFKTKSNKGAQAILNPLFFCWLFNLAEREKDLALWPGQIETLRSHKKNYYKIRHGCLQGSVE